MRKLVMVALMGAALLTACGGSSTGLKSAETTATGTTGTGTTGTGTTGTGTTGTGTTTTPVVPASITATSSLASIPSDGSTPTTITVLARNSTNNLISGVVVTFAADSGGVAVTNATTDATGAAVATLSTAGDPTIRTITVTATVGSLTATVKVPVVSGSAAAIPAVVSLTTSSSLPFLLSDGSTTATISTLARDSANNALAGVPVTFAATSGAVVITSGTTDATGMAQATLTTAGDSTLRTITITSTVGGLTATVKVPVVTGSAGATTAVASLTTNSSLPFLLSDGSTSATISTLARDGANNALAGIPVTFAATSGAVVITNGTTDATGTANATLNTGGDSTVRTITVTSKSASLSSTVAVPVIPVPATPVYSLGNGIGTAFAKGVIFIGAPGISAGGATGFTVTVVNQTDTLYSAGPVIVNLSSPCIASGQSQIFASGSSTAVTSLTMTTGIVSGTYSAKGCSGADPVSATATVGGQILLATGTITVAAASVGSIQYSSASSTTIGLKGTGLNETSTLVYTVTDSTGAPRPGVTVSFTPDTTVGGISISPTSAISAADGTVQTVVSSGVVHTVVRVKASIASPALSTESSELTISTGLPASAGFSIALGAPSYSGGEACSNVESYSIDGVIVPVTVFLADRYNNPVPDGTAVAFTTNGGHVDGSCNTGEPNGPYTPTKNEGTCTVSWTSANPRPKTTDTPPVLENGRATILATVVGEESFTDTNGSGFYQFPDNFAHLGEPFLSANETAGYVPNDYFLDFNQNGVYDPSTNIFVGITCDAASPVATCATSTLALGAPHLLIMSTSGARISFVSAPGFAVGGSTAAPTLSILNGASGTVVFNVQDTNTNSMAAGTTILATAAPADPGTLTQSPSPFVVGCSSDIGGQTLSASFAATAAGSTTMTITVVSPSGVTTSFNIPITVN